MDEELKKLQGNVLCPRHIWEDNASFSCSQFSIISTNLPVDIEPGMHDHESYEFVLPITTMPQAKVGKKRLYYEPNKVYPINSGQSHGVNDLMTGIKLISIMVDQTLMNDLFYSIIGKKGLSIGDNPFSLDAELRLLIHTFVKESQTRQVGYDFVLQSLRTQILIKLIRNCNSTLSSSIETRQPILTKNRINRVIEMIRECYNRDFSLDDLAKEANISPYHFIRDFKNQTGKTPYDYLINIRIEKAKELMHLNLNVTDICLLCGFNNHSHFTTVFKKKVGVTPTQYRRSLLG